jgi:hypothetical protein
MDRQKDLTHDEVLALFAPGDKVAVYQYDGEIVRYQYDGCFTVREPDHGTTCDYLYKELKKAEEGTAP